MLRINILPKAYPASPALPKMDPYRLTQEQRSLLKLLILYRNSPSGEGQFWSDCCVPFKVRAGFRAEMFMHLQCLQISLRRTTAPRIIERLNRHIAVIAGCEHLLLGQGQGMHNVVQAARQRSAGLPPCQQREAVAQALFPYEVNAQPTLRLIDLELDRVLDLFSLSRDSFTFLRHESSYPPARGQ